MNNETAKTLLRYTLTPQIVPRVQKLFFSGFSYIAFFMAQIYNAARLLPAGHPYLNPANIGRYGIRHVVVEAASVLSWKRENIDQILIFFMMLLGIVLLGCQIALLGMTLFVQAAHAMGPVPDTFAAYFLIPDATHDVAFVLLDRVFGVPDMFVDAGNGTTCVVQELICFDIGVSSSTPGLTADGHFRSVATANQNQITYSEGASIPWPWPFHDALHRMFEAYSIGILLIAVFIFLYFVIAIVAETAQSGTPFGRRFNHVWAPLRMVAALGMLVPLTHGLNSGQYILLFAAKWGSGFATNGWVLFSDTATTPAANTQSGDMPTLLGQRRGMVSDPNAPPVNTLIEFASVLAVCRIAYERMYHARTDRIPAVTIEAYLVNPTNPMAQPPLLSATNFQNAVTHFNGGDIQIVFGEYREDEYQTRDSRVSPTCGRIIIQLSNLPDINGPNDSNPGADLILRFYYTTLQLLWGDIRIQNPLNSETCEYASDDDLNDMLDRAAGNRWMEINRTDGSNTINQDVEDLMLEAMGGGGFSCLGKNIANRYLPIYNNPNSPLPSATFLDFHRQGYQYWIDSIVQIGAFTQLSSSEWTESLSQLGWGGAAIWYNKIAELNGTLISAAYSLPAIKTYPAIMEKIRAKRASADTDTPGATRHQLFQGPDVPVILSDEEENEIAKAMFFAQNIWMDHYADKKPAGNIYIDIVNAIFGTSGLFDMQRNADEGVHPLAQLASVGRSIVDTAIRNLGYSAAAGLGGGIINLFGVHMVGQVGMAASSFLLQVAMVGLSIGFVLFYIVPLLPFIYFFFAVGGWIKGIFEAMVGVPLWALAHIRIDGNGLPGDAALNGYYLILEVFLRPILIIFGFLASITIFSAQVQILHEIWPIVVSNVTGFDMEPAMKGTAAAAKYDANQTGGIRFFRGAVDKFFFTVIYAIVVYMLGMASFKMIDLVPNHILRWMGASVSTFGDQSGDPADNLIRNAYMGASMTGGHMSSALSQGAQAGAKMPAVIQQLSARSTQ